MIGIDTNILLRYLLKDDPTQVEPVIRLIDETCSTESPAFVCDVVIAEVVWYLNKKLRRPKAEIIKVLFDILDNPHLRAADEVAMLVAADAYSEGRGDFADYFIAALNRERGVEKTFTFDRHAARDGSFVLLGSGD